MSPYVIERIRRERAAGNSLTAIANGLNAERIPTAQGGRRHEVGAVWLASKLEAGVLVKLDTVCRWLFWQVAEGEVDHQPWRDPVPAAWQEQHAAGRGLAAAAG